MGSLLVLVLMFTVLKVSWVRSDGPIVTTPFGDVMGRYTKSYEGRKVIAFEGIPFAKPPVGDLRFKEPVATEKWEGTLMANKTYTCMQYNSILLKGVVGQEDCLYLNIYVPRETINITERLNVIVHIHGGAFMMGAPHFLAGPDYMLDKDAIFVSFNYRLGILGFLSTGDEVMPGNNGLKDQSMALTWIKKYIRFFGGDQFSITITGLSAGGASVHYHYFSRLSYGSFHKGISQSGTALNNWALTKNPLQNAKKLASLLNCTATNSIEIMKCLKGISSTGIINALPEMMLYLDMMPIVPFGPVIEPSSKTAFISRHPYNLLMERKLVNQAPWMASFTKDEGIFPIGFLMSQQLFEDIDARWDQLAPILLDYYNTACDEDKVAISTHIRDFYFKKEGITLANVDKVVKLFTDRYFKIDGEKAVRLHAKASEEAVYFYQYDYSPDAHNLLKGKLKGSAHGDDGRLWLKIFGNPQKFSANDNQMKDFLLQMIYSFAVTGIPNVNGTQWTPVSTKPEVDLLRIENASNFAMVGETNFSPMEFWETLDIYENKYNVLGTHGPVCSGKSSFQFTLSLLIVLYAFILN